jgi:hypothetical protein
MIRFWRLHLNITEYEYGYDTDTTQYWPGVFKYIRVQESINVSCQISPAEGRGIKKSIGQHRKLTQVLTAAPPGTEFAAAASLPGISASHQNFVLLMLSFLSTTYSLPGTFSSEISNESEYKMCWEM